MNTISMDLSEALKNPAIASVALAIFEVVNYGYIKTTPYEVSTVSEAIKMLDEVFIQGHGYLPAVPNYDEGGIFSVADTKKETILTVVKRDDQERFQVLKKDAQNPKTETLSCEYFIKAMYNSNKPALGNRSK